MKTNCDLFSNIGNWTLFISIIIGVILNSWKGALQALVLYIFLFCLFSIVLTASKRFDDFQKWLFKPLINIKLFGITFNWFSKW